MPVPHLKNILSDNNNIYMKHISDLNRTYYRLAVITEISARP